MNVLVLNCGSSSVKFQLIATDLEHIAQNTDVRLAHGIIERLGGAALLASSLDFLQGTFEKKLIPVSYLASTRLSGLTSLRSVDSREFCGGTSFLC